MGLPGLIYSGVIHETAVSAMLQCSTESTMAKNEPSLGTIAQPPPELKLIASGNINEAYQVLGLVHAVVSRPAPKATCGGFGGLPVQDAYQQAADSLHASALASGGDGVIHVNFDYRLSQRSFGCGQAETPVFEVYAWGTAIKRQARESN